MNHHKSPQTPPPHYKSSSLSPFILFFCHAFLLLPFTVFSQAFSITGRITGTRGNPLPGVTIIQEETRRAALSLADGTFTLPSGEASSTLSFSREGYVTQQVKVTGNVFVVVQMARAVKKSLPPRVDPVDFGLYNWKSDNASGVYSSTSAERFPETDKNFSDVLQSLPGLFSRPAGGQPGAFSHVFIRGMNSGTSNQPLFIVDGVVMNAGLNLPGAFRNMDPLYGINPADIDKVTVLSDHASTAIYGSRGANGVVLVETKAGGADSLLFSWQGQAGISLPPKGYPLMNAGQYFSMLGESFANAGLEVPEIPTLYTEQNWPENILRTAFYTGHTLSVSGGGRKSRIYASGNIKRNPGVVSGSGISSGGVRFNHQWTPARWFGSEVSFSYSQEKQNAPAAQEYPWKGNPLIYAAVFPPVSRYNLTTFPGLPEKFGAYDPHEFLREQMTKNSAGNFSGNADFSFHFLKHFSLQTKAAGSYNDFGQSYGILFPIDDFSSPEYRQWKHQAGSVFNWQLTGFLKFEKLTGKNHWLVLAGAEKYYLKAKETVDYRFEPLRDELMYLAYAFTGNNSHRNTALFGQFSYAFDKKLDFSAVFRREQLVRQKGGDLYGIFPSFSAGVWLYRNQLRETAVFSGLKIKAGWGLPGADPMHFLYYTSSGFSINLPGDPRMVIREQIPPIDPNVRWEVSGEWNYGILTQWLSGDGTLEVNYFDRLRSNVAFLHSSPTATGTAWDRGYTARICNSGFEIKAGYLRDWGKRALFANVYLQSAGNELLSFGEDYAGLRALLPGYLPNTTYGEVSPGDPVGAFRGYIKEKIFQSPAEVEAANLLDGNPETYYQDEETAPGDIKFADLDGNGRIDERDITTIGDPYPGFTYTITGGAVIGAADFALSFDGAAGYDILNLNQCWSHATGGLGNRFEEMEQRWTVYAPSATLPRLHLYDPSHNNRPHSGMVEKGNWFRMSRLSVGYTLDMPKVFPQARIFMTTYNFFTLSGYSGQSPWLGGSANAWGTDYGLYPGSATLIIGVQLGI